VLSKRIFVISGAQEAGRTQDPKIVKKKCRNFVDH